VYQRDWLDELRWGAVLSGVLVAVVAQVVITALVLRPIEPALGWLAVGLVELCIATGAFVAGWRARHAAIANGLIAALLDAAVSLAATAARTPSAVNLLSVVFLFVTFATMGAVGGLLAGQLQARRMAR
jgi:putative membrane protein (TIGR04086 family)